MQWLIVGIGTLVGTIIGQLSVYRHLRKKGRIQIDNWEYSAERREEP